MVADARGCWCSWCTTGCGCL